jgi:hypothetical protein
MSSQSVAVAPARWNSPSERPSLPTANSLALSPESLLTHHTPFVRRLDTMPDSSMIWSFAILPGVDATSVLLHVALSTADAGAGGLFVVDVVAGFVVDVLAGDDFGAARHPARKQSAAMSTASILRVTEGRR